MLSLSFYISTYVSEELMLANFKSKGSVKKSAAQSTDGHSPADTSANVWQL